MFAAVSTTTTILLLQTTTTATTTATNKTATTTTTNLTDISRWTLFLRETLPTLSFNGTAETTDAFNLTALWTTSDVTDDGPISYVLWLPYVIFTIALLGLICCSFLRFHTERGVQYRRRQEELSDKIQPGIQDGLRLLPDSTADISGCLNESPSGGNHTNHRGGGGGLGGGGVVNSPGSHQYVSQQPNGVLRGGGVPEQMTFAQYTQVRPNDRHAPTADVYYSAKLNSHANFIKKSSPSSQVVVGGNGSRGGYSNKKSAGQDSGGSGAAARRPLVFTFNINGSMVDVRCGEEERTNTFRLMPNEDVNRGDRGDECVVITEDFDLGMRGGSTMASAAELDRHYCNDEGSVRLGKRGYANHRKHGGQHRNGAIAAIADSGVHHHSNRSSVQYRASGGQRYEREGDGEPNKRNSEDEALLLWQKHL